jgi:hypothetical protein
MLRKVSAKKRKALHWLSMCFWICGVLLILSGSVIANYVRGFFAPDGIYIPKPLHQFSIQDAKGGVFTHTFRIYNLRPRRLAIKAEPDCGCTGVSWNSAVIAPFGWKDITAKMQAPGEKVSGKVMPSQQSSVNVTLRTNSTIKPYLFVFLVG